MSDTTDGKEILDGEILRKSQVHSLRDRMHGFLSEHEHTENLKELRREAAKGRAMSELVNRSREERP